MPHPEKVNPGNFKVIHVLYNDNHFSIAYGEWQDEGEVVAMRWNGDDKGDAGYPKTFGNPMWFIVTDELKEILLTALLNSKYSLKKNILKVFDTL